MVFTHLPSNALLLLVPFAPSFGVAAAVLLTRHLLSQLDVPTRQAFTMALVAPEERPAASGLTASARSLAQACAPIVTGLTLATAATPAPFLLAGGLKIAYDLALFFRFRSVPVGMRQRREDRLMAASEPPTSTFSRSRTRSPRTW